MGGSVGRLTRRGVLFKVVIAAAGLALSVSQTSAQPVNRPTRVWLSLGLGGGGAQELDANGAASFQLTAQWGPHHTMFRALGMGDVSSFPEAGSDDTIEEVGVLYGRRAVSSFGYAALAGGLAIVNAKGFAGASNARRQTIGLPVIAEAGLQSSVLGLGIQAFGNLNTVSLYGGVSLFLQVGWMP